MTPDELRKRALLPGMAGIALWMLTLAVVGVFGVIRGVFATAPAKTTVLLLSAVFAAAGLGLIRRQRWGWALTMSAAVLTSGYYIYSAVHSRQPSLFFMAFIQVVFFLYLVRPEVRERLR